MEIRTIKVIKHILDFNKTFPYFIDHIDYGRALSSKIIKGTNFDHGIFFTLLPENASSNKIYDFSCGGILSSLDDSNTRLMTMDESFSHFINNFLVENSQNLAVLEHYLAEPTNKHLEIFGVDLGFLEDEVYYILRPTTSISSIYKAVRMTSQVWHFFAVLTSFEFCQQLKILQYQDLNSICENVKYLVTSAYDGEGYIFWEKQTHQIMDKENVNGSDPQSCDLS